VILTRYACILVFLLKLLNPYSGLAQKPAIDTSDFINAPYVNYGSLSNDGRYILYIEYNVIAGHDVLALVSTKDNDRHEFPGFEKGEFSEDSKWAILQGPGDSLCFWSLGESKAPIYKAHALRFDHLSGGNEDWIAFRPDTASEDLVVLRPGDTKQTYFKKVTAYYFNKAGSLLLEKKERAEGKEQEKLFWADLKNGSLKEIWKGGQTRGYNFDKGGSQLIFLATDSSGKDPDWNIWYYQHGSPNAICKLHSGATGIDSGLRIDNSVPEFASQGDRIFFRLVANPAGTTPKPDPGAVKLDVWNYKEPPYSEQLEFDPPDRYLLAVLKVQGGPAVLRLQGQKQRIQRLQNNDDWVVRFNDSSTPHDITWKSSYHPDTWLVSTRDGSKKLIKMRNFNYALNFYDYSFSPDGRWLIYFDPEQQSYCSYEIATEKARCLTRNFPVSLTNQFTRNLPFARYVDTPGMGGWIEEGKGFLIYDDFDIWAIDPAGISLPRNITNGYGRHHHIQFRLLQTDDQSPLIPGDVPVILSAFNMDTKYNGFFRIMLNKPGNPDSLSMGPWFVGGATQLGPMEWVVSSSPQKAKGAYAWLVSRQSDTEAPNYYFSTDLMKYRSVSEVCPHKSYNWLNAELIHWKQRDGTRGTAILYKPEDFNPNKKYPVIFHYYERKSDLLYCYQQPDYFNTNINIPWFVSRGYIVCVPDIAYKTGKIGESAVNAVVSAAEYLTLKPWIDSKHMGLQGHSFGGFETNYIITHSHLFAAAMEADGPTDLISFYGALRFGKDPYSGVTAHSFFEGEQGRMGATLYDKPEWYIRNSPIFQIKQVTTPLLILHSKKDYNVPFSQGIEFFTGLCREGKKVWLLQYDRGNHGVVGDDGKDFTIRVTQFFDYYLKGAAPPKWMVEGIPANMKGLDSGLDLEPGKEP